MKSAYLLAELFFDHQGNFQFESFKDFFELPGKMIDQERTEAIKKKLLKLREA